MIALVLALAACSRGPAEPEPGPASTATTPAVAPLRWVVPGAWTTLDAPRGGPIKALYRTGTAADDKEAAQVEVLFYGTGAAGDPEKRFGEWLKQFDGDVGPGAARERFDVGALKVETVEASGTYKIDLGPKLKMRGKEQAPMQMVKERFRLVGAVVKTPDRGNWFFKMAGPDDTVQAAKGALRGMLESAQ